MENATNIETLAPPKTQRELFIELSVLKQSALQAQLQVEAKMREMVEELGATFRHEGLCTDHSDAPYLQIRQRMNKKLGREVPFFVPLQARPEPWKHRKSNKAAAPTEPTEAPVVVATTEQPDPEETAAPGLLQIQEPTSSVVEFNPTTHDDDINLD